MVLFEQWFRSELIEEFAACTGDISNGFITDFLRYQTPNLDGLVSESAPIVPHREIFTKKPVI